MNPFFFFFTVLCLFILNLGLEAATGFAFQTSTLAFYKKKVMQYVCV